MISYLKGKVVLFKWGLIILDVNGVGYRVNVAPQIHIKNNVVDTAELIELYIHEHIREDADDLYGFLTFQELELFEKLISVNGVGPKAGLNIMNADKPEGIIAAISSDNINFFTAIPGIGKKVAAKIILELKSKISDDKAIKIFTDFPDLQDLEEALLNLGYRRPEISSVLSKIPKDISSLEAKMRWCLKNLAK